jgi:hypothetical protein
MDINLLFIIMTIALAVSASAILGAVVGSFIALMVVSKKLTGTRWTFEDITMIFMTGSDTGGENR